MKPGAVFIRLLNTAVFVTIYTNSGYGDDDCQFYVKRLLNDRDSITSGVMDVNVTITHFQPNKSLNGSVRKYRIWFDNSNNRIDLDETRPLDPEHAFHSRMSLHNKNLKIIPVDDGKVCALEFPGNSVSKDRMASLPLRFVDPRSIGLYNTSFEGLHEIDYHILDKIASSSTCKREKRNTGDTDSDVLIMTQHASGGDYTTEYFLKSGQTLPSKIVSRFDLGAEKSGAKRRGVKESTISVDRLVAGAIGKTIEFPKHVEHKYAIDDELIQSETIDIGNISLNMPVDVKVYSWSELRPRIGTRLIYNNDFDDLVIWDGKEFDSMTYDQYLRSGLQHGASNDQSRRGSSANRFFGVMLLLFSVVLLLILIGRKSGRHTDD